MRTPVTQIDPRFSDPASAASEWSETLRIIEAAELFWISTVRADGRPHVTPLVAVWHEDALHFCTGSGEQKQLNLSARPEVVLTTGCSRWDEGVDVAVEGTARRVTDPGTLATLAARWAEKWDGRWQFEADGDCFRDDHGRALVYAVRPAKVLAFAKGDGQFAATRHQFS